MSRLWARCVFSSTSNRVWLTVVTGAWKCGNPQHTVWFGGGNRVFCWNPVSAPFRRETGRFCAALKRPACKAVNYLTGRLINVSVITDMCTRFWGACCAWISACLGRMSNEFGFLEANQQQQSATEVMHSKTCMSIIYWNEWNEFNWKASRFAQTFAGEPVPPPPPPGRTISFCCLALIVSEITARLSQLIINLRCLPTHACAAHQLQIGTRLKASF